MHVPCFETFLSHGRKIGTVRHRLGTVTHHSLQVLECFSCFSQPFSLATPEKQRKSGLNMASGAPTSPTTSNVPAPTAQDISTPRRRSPRVPAAAAAYLAAAAGGVVTANTTPTRRRSPRVEELANRPPTAAQLARIETEERFTRRVSPRLGGSTDIASPRRPRTRAISEAFRAKHKRSSSPHEEKKTADGGAARADDGI
jgi:hypothetical protein